MTLLTQEVVDENGVPLRGKAFKLPTKLRHLEDAIEQLKMTDIFRGIGKTSVKNVHGLHIDRQPSPPDYVNLSVQRNGPLNPSTIATVFVPVKYNVPELQDAACMGEFLQAVRHGLVKSYESFSVEDEEITRFVIIGTLSNPRACASS
jgi:hypothetical protein